VHTIRTEQGWLIWYSFGLQAAKAMGSVSILGRSKYVVSSPQRQRARLLIQWVAGALSPGVKQLGRETDHSPPSSARVKNERSYCHFPKRFHSVVHY
jgi:hypothetical protein